MKGATATGLSADAEFATPRDSAPAPPDAGLGLGLRLDLVASALFPPRRGARVVLGALLAVAALLGWLLGPSFGVLLLAASAGASIGWREPAVMPFFAILLLPAGVFAPSLFGVQAPLLEVALGSAAAGYALRLARERRRLSLGSPEAALLALLLAVGLSGAGATDAAKWLHQLALWTALAVLFHAALRVLSSERAARLFVLALGAVALFEAVFAVVEYFSGKGRRVAYLDGALVSARPEATLQHPGALALFLVLSVLPLIGLLLTQRGARQIALAAVVSAIAAGIATTFAREAWLGLVAGCLLFGLAPQARRALLGAGGVLILLALGLASSDAVFRDRLSSIASSDAVDRLRFYSALWRRAARIVVDHPLTGTGSFHARVLNGKFPTDASHPHNLWLGLAVDFGLLAALAFTALLALAALGAFRAWRLSGESQRGAVSLGALASLVVLFMLGLGDYPFWNETLATLVVLLLALAVALGRLARPSGAVASRE